MSAIVIIKQSDAVHVATDTAAYDAKGSILIHTMKAIPIPQLNDTRPSPTPWRITPHSQFEANGISCAIEFDVRR
jgi:hypothetical protein